MNESFHDDITEVLTDNGWKLFKNINFINDRLATVCPETYNLIYEKPKRLINDKHTGEMFCVEKENASFKITPNHNMLVRTWSQEKEH